MNTKQRRMFKRKMTDKALPVATLYELAAALIDEGNPTEAARQLREAAVERLVKQNSTDKGV